MLSVSTQIAPEDDLATFERMLKSVSFADAIVIYAMDRRDADFVTCAKKYHARVVPIPTPKVVEQIRARQVREAQGDWVLIMDYDEIVPLALQREIASTITNPQSKISVYTIPRRNYSLGFPVMHGGFGDDYVHRLFRKADFSDWPTDIHSTPTFHGELGVLTNYMEHHKDASIAQMVVKTNRYSEIEARQFFEGGLPRVTSLTLVRKSVMEFVRRYFVKRGFLDGRIGIVQALYQSDSVFITYAKLFELQKIKYT